MLQASDLPGRVQIELAIAKRQQWDLSLLFIEVLGVSNPGQKDANSRLADAVGQCISDIGVGADCLFRLGDFAYAVLVPNTPLEAAKSMATSISSRLKEVAAHQSPAIQVSAGIVCVDHESTADVQRTLKAGTEILSEARVRNGFAVHAI